MTAPLDLPATPRAGLWRRAPLILLLIAAGLAWYFLRDVLTFETLGRHRQALLDLRDQHYVLTSLAFILAYTLVVVTSLPGAIIMTLTGGFLFGLFPGFVYNVIAATLGAVIVFLAARAGFGRDFAQRIEARGGAVANLQTALRQNEWSVLLTMRLIPVIPFFIANLIPAFVGVRFSAFVITTAVGILPADLIYTALGAGLGDVFARGETPSLDILLRPEFGLPLIGLGLMAALPMVVRFIRGRKG